ncbi:hypothetical protein ABIB00_003898 [Bradyrhizobium sp. LB14.3]|uniref:hypothetical protein n=1 Tax=Bradyrhizobium sp. LB14.3 TaxID=3156328 RepID=UPI003397B056
MSQYSLDALRQRYVVEKRPLEASVEQILRADTRAGARAILASIDKRRFENRSEGQRLRKILGFETSLWESGVQAVAGVDEAGMSPLAGPVSAGAVILKPGTRIVGIDDSKKLDAAAREELAKEIKEKAESWCISTCVILFLAAGAGAQEDKKTDDDKPADPDTGESTVEEKTLGLLPNPLQKFGVKFAATYIGETLGNPFGGLKQGAIYEKAASTSQWMSICRSSSASTSSPFTPTCSRSMATACPGAIFRTSSS